MKIHESGKPTEEQLQAQTSSIQPVTKQERTREEE